MPNTLKPGQKVHWSSTQGEVQGTVERKVTTPTQVKGHVAKPTAENPQYLVKSTKTGAKAVHKQESLKKS